jgi:transcription elongation GreA/GreB family factor
MDKHALMRDLTAQLAAEIARAIESAERTRSGAVHEEARPENDKDTRALEASYLARGQAQRVVDLQLCLKQVSFMEVRAFGPDDAIGLSALVRVESEADSRWYLFAAAGGGHRLRQGALQVDVVSPESPLGRSLAGKYRGEELTLRSAGTTREYVIAELR